MNADEPLPLLVHAPESIARRLPSQRVLDAIEKAEPGLSLKEVSETQPMRLNAFRVLLRDFPDRDPTSLWLHSYDVEVELDEPDPTGASGPTAWPPSAGSGG